MTTIDRRLLQRFVELACERLAGDWVILGGTVLTLLGIEQRVTFDIDLAGPDEADNRQLLIVMEIAEELGLAPEAINQAAAFHLRRIQGWEGHLVPLCRGSGARLYRPDATLFLLSKIGRLSDADLSDCLRMLEYAGRIGEALDLAVLRETLWRALRESDLPPGRRERLQDLAGHLGAR